MVFKNLKTNVEPYNIQCFKYAISNTNSNLLSKIENVRVHLLDDTVVDVKVSLYGYNGTSYFAIAENISINFDVIDSGFVATIIDESTPLWLENTGSQIHSLYGKVTNNASGKTQFSSTHVGRHRRIPGALLKHPGVVPRHPAVMCFRRNTWQQLVRKQRKNTLASRRSRLICCNTKNTCLRCRCELGYSGTFGTPG